MPDPFIKYLRIENYKSIDKLELHDLPAFAVFAGANGSGKSNFFDAMEFINRFVRFGIDEALNGNFQNIHCLKRSPETRSILEFEIDLFCKMDDPNGIFNQQMYYAEQYKLLAQSLDTEPVLQEWFEYLNDGTWSKSRTNGEGVFHNTPHQTKENEVYDLKFPIANTTTLLNHIDSKLVRLLRTTRVFAINPQAALSDRSGQSNAELNKDGSNLVTVLERLEQDEKTREIILDMLSLCVPSIENINVKKNHLNMSSELYFKHEGIAQEFPMGMVSDGTVALLCILVAVLDTKKRAGLTMIEEPERGLHPKAIGEMIALMREQATPEQPIWLTTHSETVIRFLQDGELWFVDKPNGATRIKKARNFTPNGLTRNQAWLSNGLGGGLPW